MNKWQKIGLAVGMGTAVITTTHLINSIIFKSSTANNYTGKRIRSNYRSVIPAKAGIFTGFSLGQSTSVKILTTSG